MQKSRYAVFGFAAVIVIGGLAYYTGYLPQKTGPDAGLNNVQQQPAVTTPASPPIAPAESAPSVAQDLSDQKAPAEIAKTEDKPQPSDAALEQDSKEQAPEQAKISAPNFDVLRVEPDGSLVIAGKASTFADVDVISGARVLGTTKAGENGDFAIVLDRALKAGDHQLVLRATDANGQVATSAQTAIVSIPDKNDGPVLALVEEPGQASRMISKPQPLETPKPEAGAEPKTVSPTAPATTPTEANPAPQISPAPQVTEAPIAVEAVEIEGNTIFVAGQAKRGNHVSVYANEIFLGGSPVTTGGRFLVQSQQPLAVGDYIIRADLIDKTNTVIASARVPFRREAGEKIAAVARDITQQNIAPSKNTSVANTNEPAAQPMESVEGSVIIRKGDNLWTISKRTYGRGTRYTTIYLANEDQIHNPDLIWPGQVFTMPKDALTDEEAEQRLRDRQR